MKNSTLLVLAVSLVASAAIAQVTVNPNALDPAAKPAARPAPPPLAAPAAPARPPAAKPAAPAAPAVTIPSAPPAAANVPAANPAANAPSPPGTPQTMPAAAPAAPTLPPATAVPARPAPPPTPVTIAADAPGSLTTTPDGARLTFGPGRADMTPASAEAIRTIARAGRTATTVYNVTALAAGSADDPSAARRLSLSRGLAIRSLLITEGIPSTRIYVRALGNNAEATGSAPPDRADIAVARPEPAKPQPAAKPTP